MAIMPWQQIGGTHHAVLYIRMSTSGLPVFYVLYNYIIANMRTPYGVIGKIAAVFELLLQMHQQTVWLDIIYYIEGHKHQSWSTINMQNQIHTFELQ